MVRASSIAFSCILVGDRELQDCRDWYGQALRIALGAFLGYDHRHPNEQHHSHRFCTHGPALSILVVHGLVTSEGTHVTGVFFCMAANLFGISNVFSTSNLSRVWVHLYGR